MIHNHEVPSSILGPATKKDDQSVILFSYLSLARLQPLEVVSQSKMLAEDFEVGLCDANDLGVISN